MSSRDRSSMPPATAPRLNRLPNPVSNESPSSASICDRASSVLFRSVSEQIQQSAPPVWRVDLHAHVVAAGAVALEVTMFEIHARPSAWFRGEADVDFARLREVRLIAPLVRDLPREHEPMRRLPDEHRPPITLGAVLLLGVAAAAGFSFDDRLRHRRLADVVSARPPRVVPVREYFERVLDARVHDDRFLHCCFGDTRHLSS